MKLRDSEEVVHVEDALRQQLFRGRHGKLYITNHRVAFVVGDRPLVELDRARVRAEKVARKRSFELVLTCGHQRERFDMPSPAIDKIVTLLAPDEDAPSLNHYKS